MSDATYGGPERRKNPDDVVTRRDFDKHLICIERYRREQIALHAEADKQRDAMLDTVTKRLDAQDDTLNKIDRALFYKPTDNNDDTPPGIVPVLRKIDRHVDVVCGIGRWGWKSAVAVLAILVPLGTIFHWW